MYYLYSYFAITSNSYYILQFILFRVECQQGVQCPPKLGSQKISVLLISSLQLKYEQDCEIILISLC